MAKITATGLDNEVLKRFKQLVIAKHGTLRGCLGEVLWISMEENKQKRG